MLSPNPQDPSRPTGLYGFLKMSPAPLLWAPEEQVDASSLSPGGWTPRINWRPAPQPLCITGELENWPWRVKLSADFSPSPGEEIENCGSLTR